jgi:hypothetical protein
MEKLCVASNAIARIKSTSVATAKTVLDDAKRIAIAASTTSGTTIPPPSTRGLMLKMKPTTSIKSTEQ